MASSTLWRRFLRWLGARFYSVSRIQKALSRTGDRYIDVEGWRDLRGVNEEVAKRELALGVQLGHFERYYLYEWDDAPVPFVVPERFLGKSIRMSDVGYIGEDDDLEIHLARNRVREVFVARSTDEPGRGQQEVS